MTSSVKPSELPKHTIIEDPAYGLMVKETSKLWVELSPARHGPYYSSPYTVSDTGFENDRNRPSHYVVEKSDIAFQDFKILSVPMGWVYPGVEKEVVVWYDLGKQHAVRKTTIHEIIEDRDDLMEEELAFAKPKVPTWWDIPGHPKYETCVSGRNNTTFVRTKKSGIYRRRRENGFFVIYENRKRVLWCEGELGTADQIESFYKTGVVG